MKKAINEIARGVKWKDSSITPKSAQNKAEWDSLVKDLDHDLKTINEQFNLKNNDE